MTVTKQLYELQELDTDIEHTMQTLDLKTSQIGKRDVLDNALAQLKTEQKNMEELKHQRREAEAELEDMTSKINAANQQLYGGRVTNSKELSNLQHEVNTLKSVNDELETKALEIIDRMENAEKTVATATNDYEKLEAEWQQQQKQLDSDIALLKKTLTDLTEKRRQLSGQIESPALNLYERVRQQKHQAVAKVEQGICRACRISISASNLQKARGGQPVQCGSCGRILFISS
jgi:predicted  nucleic acid-binding Zn-ribbon protein